MNKGIIRNFLFSQAVADGVRTTISILLPVLLLRKLGYFDAGLAMSLGALSVNITDIPGPYHHRRNGMLISSVLIFFFAALTPFIQPHLTGVCVLVTVSTFLFSMTGVYGVRAGTVGSSALVVLILSLGNTDSTAADIFLRAALILAGAIWYILLSLTLSRIRPYRMAQRSLGECIFETATLLSIKADFFDPATDLKKNYKKVLVQQSLVADKQEAVRELLYKTRQIVRDTSGIGRAMMLTFVDMVDLFEQITHSVYDYRMIRKMAGKSTEGIHHLLSICLIARYLAVELNKIGRVVQTGDVYKPTSHDLQTRIDDLRIAIRNSEFQNLSPIIDNLEHMLHKTEKMCSYLEEDFSDEGREIEHHSFVNHQDYSFALFRENLSFDSSIFRHSLRVSVAALAGLLLSTFLVLGDHGYWVLMTIVFIMKPAFSLTRTRNIQRLIGTFAGGVLGVLILYSSPGKELEFALLVFFMTGTYSFMRLNYVTTVIFTTPYVLIMFHLLGTSPEAVIAERLIDTAIGCVIAISASYLLWPQWESQNINNLVQQMIKAQRNYSEAILKVSSGEAPMLQYKHARREVYIAGGNLSAAFQRMLSEPASKQLHSSELFEFVVLNHTLSANLGSVASTLLAGKTPPADQLENVDQAFRELDNYVVKQHPTRTDDADEPPFLVQISREYCRTGSVLSSS